MVRRGNFGKIFILAVFGLLIRDIVFANPFVDQNLSAKLGGDGEEALTVIVVMKDYSDESYLEESPNSLNFRSQKMQSLMKNHSKGQNEILSFIKKSGKNGSIYEATPLWLSNSIVLKAQKSVISDLLSNNAVESIHESRTFRISDFRREYTETWESSEESIEGLYTYGLSKINIPKVNESFPGLFGKGVRVGHIDTGVSSDHPDLKGKVILFKDFINSQTKPYDDNDHGTHTAGTIAGGSASGTRIGVAPQVELIVAKVFDKDGSGDEAILLKAMEWIADPDGDPRTPDGPIVVSNSWGGPAGTMEQERPLYNAVKNWVALGIFPCFAAGNEGPNPQTISTPGGYSHSFSVGATDENDMVAEFSSRGPFFFNGLEYSKPEVSAPGDKIYSSLSNGKWAKFSGTSMATPHVAGLVALIFSVNPNLSVNQIGWIITSSSKDIDQKGYDFNTGWGRIDAYNSLSKLVNGTQLDLFP